MGLAVDLEAVWVVCLVQCVGGEDLEMGPRNWEGRGLEMFVCGSLGLGIFGCRWLVKRHLISCCFQDFNDSQSSP